MQPTTAQWLGIAISGLIGATALVWNVFKHLSDRRQANRQRLLDRTKVIEIKHFSFVVDIRRGKCASLTVRNSGTRDVYIESVRFVYPHVSAERTKSTLTETAVPLKPFTEQPEPLKPGSASEYLLYLWPGLDGLSECIATRRCRISVNSHAGEIGRLTGDDVAPVLELLLDAHGTSATDDGGSRAHQTS
jgi:hypothetical protein